jgi:hypothetical protein
LRNKKFVFGAGKLEIESISQNKNVFFELEIRIAAHYFCWGNKRENFMLNRLEFARQKLRVLKEFLHDYVSNAESRKIPKREFEIMVDLLLDSINQVKRLIKNLEKKKK